MLNREYRVVQTYVNQGESPKFEVCLISYEEIVYNQHTSRSIVSWEPMSNPFVGLHSADNAKIHGEIEYKDALEAFNKPILVLCPETLKEQK